MPETIVSVTLPEMGESVTEGSIVEWRVKPGQWIEAGATLVDVTTDKVDVEVPAPAVAAWSRRFSPRKARRSPSARRWPRSTRRPRSPAGGCGAVRACRLERSVSPGAVAAPAKPAPQQRPRIRRACIASRCSASPSASISISPSSRGTGPDGLILREDVIRATATPAGRAALAATARPPRRPARRLRRRRGRDRRAAQGPRRLARRLHGAEPHHSDRDELPHAAGRRARSSAAPKLNAALKAAGRSEKALVHASDRLRARARGAADRRDRRVVPAQRTARPRASRAASIWASRSTLSAKTARAFSSCPSSRTPTRSTSRRSARATKNWSPKRATASSVADELTGATFTLTNPGGIGTVASVPRLMAGSRRDHRGRRDRLSAGLPARARSDPAATRRREDR